MRDKLLPDTIIDTFLDNEDFDGLFNFLEDDDILWKYFSLYYIQTTQKLHKQIIDHEKYHIDCSIYPHYFPHIIYSKVSDETLHYLFNPIDRIVDLFNHTGGVSYLKYRCFFEFLAKHFPQQKIDAETTTQYRKALSKITYLRIDSIIYSLVNKPNVDCNTLEEYIDKVGIMLLPVNEQTITMDELVYITSL